MSHLTAEQKENAEKLIAWLDSEAAEQEFDMHSWIGTTTCGSVMCMGGYLEHVLYSGPLPISVAETGALIGLDDEEASYAFLLEVSMSQSLDMPENFDVEDVTLPMARVFMKQWVKDGLLSWEFARDHA